MLWVSLAHAGMTVSFRMELQILFFIQSRSFKQNSSYIIVNTTHSNGKEAMKGELREPNNKKRKQHMAAP
jgi:hypothetical protein